MTVCSQVPVLGWLKELCGHWNCLPSDEVLDSNWPFSYLFYRIYVDFIPLEVELQPLYLSTMWSKHSLYSNRPLTPPLETSLPPHALVSVWPPHLSPIGMLLYSPPCTKQGAHSIPGIPSCYLMLLNIPPAPIFFRGKPKLLSVYAQLLVVRSGPLSSPTIPCAPDAQNPFLQSGSYAFICPYPVIPSLCLKCAFSHPPEGLLLIGQDAVQIPSTKLPSNSCRLLLYPFVCFISLSSIAFTTSNCNYLAMSNSNIYCSTLFISCPTE